jgi:hypothetical protein
VRGSKQGFIVQVKCILNPVVVVVVVVVIVVVVCVRVCLMYKVLGD